MTEWLYTTWARFNELTLWKVIAIALAVVVFLIGILFAAF